MSLRSRVDKLVAESAPEPEPWDHLHDPCCRLGYIVLALPVPLLDAEQAVNADPRRPAIEAAAERREPVLAAFMREVDAAVKAYEGDAEIVLSSPSAEVLAAAKEYLWGEANNPLVFLPNGCRLRRRSLPEAHVYDVATIDGAVAVVLDAWAYRVLLLNQSPRSLWYSLEIDAGIAWYEARYGEL